MTQSLVPVEHASTTKDALELAAPAFELAQRIASTDFVPRALRGKPEAVMAAILTGYEVGIGPMNALAKIHVIEGRPAMAAELMRALILRAGHDFWVEEATNTKVTVGGKRAGSARETRFTWTMDDAKRANLVGKDNWRKYPRAMLLARATAEIARAIFPEVLAGISYTIEELTDGDVIDVEDLGGDEPTDAKPAKRTTKKRAARKITRDEATEASETIPDAEVVPPLPGEDDAYEGPDQHLTPDDVEPDDGPRMPAANALAMKAREVGVPSDEARHGLWAAVTAGKTSSANDLDDAGIAAARAALVHLERGTAALGHNALEDIWALIDAGDGTILHASKPAAPKLTFELLAPASHAGKRYTVPEAAPAAPETASGAGEGAPAPAPAPEAPVGPEAAPDPLGDDEDFITADAWRAWLRHHGLKVAEALKVASSVAGELRVGDANTPRSMDDLAAADAGLGRAVRQRLLAET